MPYSHPDAAEAVRSTNGKEIWLDGHCWTLVGRQEAEVTVAKSRLRSLTTGRFSRVKSPDFAIRFSGTVPR
jgi:hypothetical protein